MNRKTELDFRNQALKNNIHFWKVHDCSICGYGCGYIFFNEGWPEVVYDSGCDCTRRYIKEKSTWDSVSTYYNMQRNENVIKEMDEFWRFTK